MPRKLPQLELDAQTRTALEERRTTASSSHRKRLEAILLASEHFDRTTIAARLGVSCNSVTSWIQCFLKNGFEGLESKPHILQTSVLHSKLEEIAFSAWSLYPNTQYVAQHLSRDIFKKNICQRHPELLDIDFLSNFPEYFSQSTIHRMVQAYAERHDNVSVFQMKQFSDSQKQELELALQLAESAQSKLCLTALLEFYAGESLTEITTRYHLNRVKFLNYFYRYEHRGLDGINRPTTPIPDVDIQGLTIWDAQRNKIPLENIGYSQSILDFFRQRLQEPSPFEEYHVEKQFKRLDGIYVDHSIIAVAFSYFDTPPEICTQNQILLEKCGLSCQTAHPLTMLEALNHSPRFQPSATAAFKSFLREIISHTEDFGVVYTCYRKSLADQYIINARQVQADYPELRFYEVETWREIWQILKKELRDSVERVGDTENHFFTLHKHWEFLDKIHEVMLNRYEKTPEGTSLPPWSVVVHGDWCKNFDFTETGTRGYYLTPINYQGGKRTLLADIFRFLPDFGSYDSYCEPFSGSAAVFFALPPVQREILNDWDKRIVTFWKVLKHKPQKFSAWLQAHQPTEENHNKARQILNHYDDITRSWTQPHSDLEIAWAVQQVLNGGHWGNLEGNWRGEKAESLATILRKYENLSQPRLFSRRLRNVTIKSMDAVQLIQQENSERHFLYLDPPYPNTQCGHYQNNRNYFAHLSRALRSRQKPIRSRWLLSLFPANELVSLVNALSLNVAVIFIKGTGKRQGKCKCELLVANYSFRPEYLRGAFEEHEGFWFKAPEPQLIDQFLTRWHNAERGTFRFDEATEWHLSK